MNGLPKSARGPWGGTMRRGGDARAVGLGFVVVLATLVAGSGEVGAKVRKGTARGPMLWITADRVSGFAPLTVSLYGKIVGASPDQVELCHAAVAPLSESVSGEGDRGIGHPAQSAQETPQAFGQTCEPGTLKRTAEGYDYLHNLRFASPGTYQVRMRMVDEGGKRVLSNPVQVTAF